MRLVGVSPVVRQRADPEPADPKPADPEPADPEPADPDAADAGTVLIFDRAR